MTTYLKTITSSAFPLCPKRLVKLTLGLNFINILRTAFTLPELFKLSGSTSLKAEHKYVGEIDTR